MDNITIVPRPTAGSTPAVSVVPRPSAGPTISIVPRPSTAKAPAKKTTISVVPRPQSRPSGISGISIVSRPKRRRVGPPVTAEQVIARVNVTPEQAKEIENYEQKSEEWLDARKGRLTASNYGSIYGVNQYKSRRSFLKDMVWGSKFRGCAATQWGSDNEPVAFAEYERIKLDEIARNMERLDEMSEEEKDQAWVDLEMSETGLVINPERPWLGNSPDGLIKVTYASGRVEVGLLEIKCPYGKVFYSEKYGYAVPPQYMAQIQGTMGNIGFPWCDFFVWTPTGTQLTRVDFDPAYWEDMLQSLTTFYFDEYIPLVVKKENGELDEGQLDQSYEMTL